MSGRDSPSDKPLVEPLTRREREILGLLAEGFSAPEIAESLTLAVSSVKSHIQHIYGKLDVRSKRQALTRAQALGLLESTPASPKPAEAPVVAAGPTDRVAAGPPSNLPVQLTHFIGRDKELADINSLLEGGARLITLTGPGGTGKTRLALETAGASLGDFPDGAWLVELAAVAQPGLVAQAVAQALGARAAAGRTPEQELALHLRGQHALIVLDNCEHLVVACAQLADHLLRAAPGMSIMATSREPLGLAGETTYPVPSLSLPDARQLPAPTEMLAASEAVRLFVERATATRPDFTLTEANAAAVAQICRRLDGIPLALELAAARVRALSVEQIAERLNDRFRLLAGGSRMAPARQQTLSGAIDWSYDLLSEPEQALLRRLSVFAGGWTLEAAEQVGAGTGDVLDLLALLVAKSLVVSEQQPGQAARFWLLETIREYAHDKLVRAGEARTARDRHLAFCVALAETAAPELRHHNQVEWTRRLDQESDNWRAALTWALEQEDAEAALRLVGALCEYWKNIFGFVEGSRWAHAALNLPNSNGPLARSGWRARALLTAGWLSPGTNQAVRQWMEESLDIYREHGDRAHIAEALMRMGEVYRSPSQSAATLQLLEETLELWEALGDEWGIGTCLIITGEVLDRKGEHAKALETYQRSVPFLREAGDRYTLMITQIQLAGHSWFDGDADRARMLLRESLAISRASGLKFGTWQTHNFLFDMALAQGDYDQARAEALEIQKTTGFKREKGSVRVRLGQVEYLQGHLAEARAHFEAALEVYRELNDRTGLGWTPPWLGSIAYREGDLDQARAQIDAGLAIQDPDEPWNELAFSLLSRGDVARVQSELADAALLYARPLRMVIEHGVRPDVAQYLEAFAKLAVVTTQPSRAAQLLGAAQALRDEIGTPVPPVEQAEYDRALAETRTLLDPATFSAAWAEGQALDWQQAAAYALETQPDP